MKTNWHIDNEEKILEVLETSLYGLSQEQVALRINKFGKNELPEGKYLTLWMIILLQLKNPLIFVLIAATIASIAIGEVKDAVFILLVIVINTGLGAYQEYSAEKSARGLKKLLKIKARVKRDNTLQNILSEDLVPGDIVFLESGIKVPADLRILELKNLEIDESLLTGESVGVEKNLDLLPETTNFKEATNIAFAGSTVLNGRGIGVVFATGLQTQVGLIADKITASISAKPPLILRMEKFVKQISLILVVISVIIALVLGFQGMDILSIFFYIVALAVSAIPEGLPVALTVALSIATKRMAKRNVVIRKLTSVESLGSCTVIASDKTGTLTVNQQTAKKIIFPHDLSLSITGEGYNGEGAIVNSENNNPLTAEELAQTKELNEIAILANEGNLEVEGDTWTHSGDAMDVALLGMSYKMGIVPESFRKEHPLIDTIPYESVRKFSGAIYQKEEEHIIALKGAAETILDFCSFVQVNNQRVNIDKEAILAKANKLASQGFRVLAFAKGVFPNFTKKNSYRNEDIPSITFYGLVGFIDPLRTEAIDAVTKCKEAGIKVLMITGDHPETAGTIATELGIHSKDKVVVSGEMLKNAGLVYGDNFQRLIISTNVFARVSPQQKLEIIDSLIHQGEFVAVTGDGINDAPALKRANIGVAMGSGTDVAKEVGSMIIVDDNFSPIVAGVEEGRFAYDNIRKVVLLLISTGAAEVLLFIAAISVGVPLPLLAVQLLWLNLVTNGIQDVALAFEGGEPNTMKKKPRKPTEKIFNPLMIQQTIAASFTMATVAFSLWFWLLNYTDMSELHARNIVLLLMVFMQNLHVFNCRSESISLFKVPISKNYVLVFGVFLAQGIHILAMQTPFMQNILQVEPITFNEWLITLSMAVPIIIVMEGLKLFRGKK